MSKEDLIQFQDLLRRLNDFAELDEESYNKIYNASTKVYINLHGK